MNAATTTADFITVAVEEGIATIALDRPEKMNALNDQMRGELIAAFDTVGADVSVRAIILTGNGKAFCAGGDIAGMRGRLDAPAGEVAFNGWKRQRKTHRGVEVIHHTTKPVIAAVNGAAMGLGLDMALACDFIIAADSAKMGMSFLKRGLVSDGGGMYFLPRRVGLSKAKELILTARTLEAPEALSIGMVDRIAPADSLLDDAKAWAKELTVGSPAAVALTKEILDQSFESSDDQIFTLGRAAQAICYTSAEHRQSVEAFLAKQSK